MFFKDQHWNQKESPVHKPGDGKEVCDLLVVFENHVIIFSDKDCDFPNTGDLEVDWKRWYKKAVVKSAKQVCGAERWIREHPDRLFLDRACTEPFPINIPDPGEAIFHRIVVAHGAAERCKAELGGSGSLMIMPDIVGADHYAPSGSNPVTPFAIGQVDPKCGYVHVLDDTTLDVVLGVLDTVSDFVEYLTKKEELILSGKLGIAAGEEELLGFYMVHFDDSGQKGFRFPADDDVVWLSEGHWDYFVHHPRRQTQIAANEISYFWDQLIETFNKHLIAGTQYYYTHADATEQERILRFLARENRTRRRMLSRAFVELLTKTPPDQRATRVLPPTRPSEPHYVFLLVPFSPQRTYDANRNIRRQLLEACCMVVKLMFGDAEDIVAIATETGRGVEGSEDALYFDARGWTAEQQEEAKRLQADFELLVNLTRSEGTEYEYPDPPSVVIEDISDTTQSRPKGRDRNKLCPCGSGKKYKKCCGSP